MIIPHLDVSRIQDTSLLEQRNASIGVCDVLPDQPHEIYKEIFEILGMPTTHDEYAERERTYEEEQARRAAVPDVSGLRRF